MDFVRGYRYHLTAFFMLLIITGCATNPVTGEKQLMLLSKSEEIQMGKQTNEQVIQTYGVYQENNLNDYVTNLGLKMAKLSHRPDLPWEFKVLDSPVINAFAVPGGFVYVTRGILAYLNNEAELAGVVGHEIGHVTARHSAQQYSKAQLAQLGLGLGSILSETFRKYAGVAQFGVQMLFLKFSRDHERQADKLGVEYSTEAGFDARQMANFFVTLERMNPSGDQGGLPEWFSTHPNPEERVDKIHELAKEWEQKVSKTNFIVDRRPYLEKIDGIVFGDDPRQGYVENGMFYHPELTFQFPVPSGWKVNNTPSQVQMASPDEDAVILFAMDDANSPSAAAQKFLSNSNATVISRNTTTVGGFPAEVVVSQINSQDGILQVQSYFIQKGQNVFLFHGFTEQSRFGQYQQTFSSVMDQFRNLNEASKINVQPDRIRIRTVSNGGTLRRALSSLGAANEDLEKLSLINGMTLDESVAANTRIKIIQKGR